jgi:hypothetical protein
MPPTINGRKVAWPAIHRRVNKIHRKRSTYIVYIQKHATCVRFYSEARETHGGETHVGNLWRKERERAIDLRKAYVRLRDDLVRFLRSKAFVCLLSSTVECRTLTLSFTQTDPARYVLPLHPKLLRKMMRFSL